MTLKQIKAHEEKCKRVASFLLHGRIEGKVIFKLKGMK